MDLNIKKLFQKDGRRKSAMTAERVMAWCLIALGAIGILLLVLDIYIFYTYSYTVVNEDATSNYSIDIKKSTIEGVAGAFADRQKKFETLKSHPATYPDPFR